MATQPKGGTADTSLASPNSPNKPSKMGRGEGDGGAADPCVQDMARDVLAGQGGASTEPMDMAEEASRDIVGIGAEYDLQPEDQPMDNTAEPPSSTSNASDSETESESEMESGLDVEEDTGEERGTSKARMARPLVVAKIASGCGGHGQGTRMASRGQTYEEPISIQSGDFEDDEDDGQLDREGAEEDVDTEVTDWKSGEATPEKSYRPDGSPSTSESSLAKSSPRETATSSDFQE